MQLLNLRLPLFCVVLWGCQVPEKSALLQENSTTRLVEVVSTLSPEESILMNKIADRTSLQEVVDHASQEQTQAFNFACSAQSGGVAVYLRKAHQLCGIRLSFSQEKTGRSTRWYYQNKEKATLVVHEKNQHFGDQEYIEQVVFFLDENKILKVLYRVIQGSHSRLESLLETISFQEVDANSQANLWKQLQKDEQQLLKAETSKNTPSYFCP